MGTASLVEVHEVSKRPALSHGFVREVGFGAGRVRVGCGGGAETPAQERQRNYLQSGILYTIRG